MSEIVIVNLLTTLPLLITAIATLVTAIKAKNKAAVAEKRAERIEQSVNGELLTRIEAARREGLAAGARLRRAADYESGELEGAAGDEGPQ